MSAQRAHSSPLKSSTPSFPKDDTEAFALKIKCPSPNQDPPPPSVLASRSVSRVQPQPELASYRLGLQKGDRDCTMKELRDSVSYQQDSGEYA